MIINEISYRKQAILTSTICTKLYAAIFVVRVQTKHALVRFHFDFFYRLENTITVRSVLSTWSKVCDGNCHIMML